MCQPVAENDDHNADTEPQTQEDEYIHSIADPELLRWEKYLTCLKDALPVDEESEQSEYVYTACAVRVTVVGFVCLLLTSRVFVRLTKDTIYLTGNEGQKICGVFSENAPLQS